MSPSIASAAALLLFSLGLLGASLRSREPTFEWLTVVYILRVIAGLALVGGIVDLVSVVRR